VRLGIRSRLFLVWLGPILASLLVAGVFLVKTFDRLFVRHVSEELLIRLEICEKDAAQRLTNGQQVEWHALAHELGRRVHARVAFIDPHGTILGDSDLAPGALPSPESHRDRPEILAALTQGTGIAVVRDTLDGSRLLHVARPVKLRGRLVAVIRLSAPLREGDAAVARLRSLLVHASLLGLGVALLMAIVGSHLMSRSVRHLTKVATRMAAGDLEIRTRAHGKDELAALGQALDTLADSLATTLGDIREERDLLQRILGTMSEGILVLDGAGRIVLANQALRQMFLLGSDILRKPLIEVVRHASLLELVERARESTEPAAAELETVGLRPRKLLVSMRQLAGSPPSLLGVFVDVTDIRRLESLRREFVASASHELRTPVATIRLAVDALQGGAAQDPEGISSFLAMIQRNAERLQQLIDDMMELSRIECREFRLSIEPTPLWPLVDSLLRFFGDAANHRNIRLMADIPEDTPLVLADRRALEKVLSNLLDNATKYCTPGATVIVRAHGEGPSVVITVEDTGPGIEAHHLPRIFERFYRVDKGRSRELGGTGLGLAIVKHLSEAMHGAVSVESAPGVGSTFRVSLPAAAPPSWPNLPSPTFLAQPSS